MEQLNDIRNWLKSMRGNLPGVAESTGLSTKTLYRIANEPDYSVNLRTLEKLSAAKETADRLTEVVKVREKAA